jgi:hypothetical protein
MPIHLRQSLLRYWDSTLLTADLTVPELAVPIQLQYLHSYAQF